MSVFTVVNTSMAGRAESTALMPATLQKGLVKPMSHDLLMREAQYQSSMKMFKGLMEQGFITQQNYAEAERLMREKYQPVAGTLFVDMTLT